MKRLKSTLSFLLALVLSFTVLSGSGFSFAAQTQEPVAVANYGELVEQLTLTFQNREESVYCLLDTTDENIYYAQSPAEMLQQAIDAVFYDSFGDSQNPDLGDYLYNSVKSYTQETGVRTYVEKRFLTEEDAANNKNYELIQHYCLSFKLTNIAYFSTKAQEEVVKRFAQEFNRCFITEGMSDYQIVKTVYDFLIRNTSYDDAVFLNQYSETSARYNIAHSAYGAICGNLVHAGKAYSDYAFDTINTVTNQKVIAKADQGLAVCEGYSKLFYYLCTMNGVKCHIVDGDYADAASKGSDPHEWNYVYLDDGLGDGYQWYQVDSTFAEQNSIKELHFHSYDLFLRGTGNAYFSRKKHQQAYDFSYVDKQQLYDWYSNENKASVRDYAFAQAQVSANNAISHGFIISRKTDYKDGEGYKYSYIYTDGQQMQTIRIEEDGSITRKNINGFGYTGYEAEYDVFVPYLINDCEYVVQGIEGVAQGNNDYPLTIYGAKDSEGKDTSVTVKFHVTPYDMSGENAEHYQKVNIQKSANYTGAKATPKIEIVDSYCNRLTQNTDYTVSYYSDKAYTKKVSAIKNIGTYYVDISFKDNYSGHYRFTFTMNKINLADMSLYNNKVFGVDYIPKYFRNRLSPKITSPAVYYQTGISKGLTVGDLKILPSTDFKITSKGGLEYGNTGTITLTGLSTSKKVQAGKSKTIQYKVNKKYNITQLKGMLADNKKDFAYTGSAIKPKSFNVLDKMLIKGKDYQIVSYRNNVNAGKAYVKIKGIGGCTGTTELVYYINPADFSKAKIKSAYKNNKLTYTVKYNKKTLKYKTDFTVSKKKTKYGYLYTFKGKGNYAGTQYLKLYLKSTK